MRPRRALGCGATGRLRTGGCCRSLRRQGDQPAVGRAAANAPVAEGRMLPKRVDGVPVNHGLAEAAGRRPAHPGGPPPPGRRLVRPSNPSLRIRRRDCPLTQTFIVSGRWRGKTPGGRRGGGPFGIRRLRPAFRQRARAGPVDRRHRQECPMSRNESPSIAVGRPSGRRIASDRSACTGNEARGHGGLCHSASACASARPHPVPRRLGTGRCRRCERKDARIGAASSDQASHQRWAERAPSHSQLAERLPLCRRLFRRA